MGARARARADPECYIQSVEVRCLAAHARVRHTGRPANGDRQTLCKTHNIDASRGATINVIGFEDTPRGLVCRRAARRVARARRRRTQRALVDTRRHYARAAAGAAAAPRINVVPVFVSTVDYPALDAYLDAGVADADACGVRYARIASLDALW